MRLSKNFVVKLMVTLIVSSGSDGAGVKAIGIGVPQWMEQVLVNLEDAFHPINESLIYLAQLPIFWTACQLMAYYGYPQYDSAFIINTCEEKVEASFDLLWLRKTKVYHIEQSYKQNKDQWADGPPPEEPGEEDAEYDYNFPF